jgi:nicotinate phosphoribosyltransferase
VRKRSTGKATWPGRRQIYRQRDDEGRLVRDVVTRADETLPGEPLLVPVVRAGRRLAPPEPLPSARARAARELAALPPALRSLAPGAVDPVEFAPALRALVATLDRQDR